MISATALNASTVPLNKSPQMPLGLDNSRLRVDSQKFLVPSLPVSSRQLNPRIDHNNGHSHHNPHLSYPLLQHHNGSGDKRRERSILNGTGHPIPPPDGLRIGGSHGLNGLRRSTSPLGGKGSSPSYPHMQGSPRKDAHSPMYGGEVPFSGSPGSSYSARSSVPIPCSSPSPGASASPKSTNSHSPNSNGNPYSPHLPPGLGPAGNGASELSQLAVAAAAASSGRLYPPGFPPPSAAVAHHAALYAAAAAAGHSLPYAGLFGSPFPPHPAAASSYLDFHSKLLRNSSAAELRSPSQSPPSRSSYLPSVSPQQQGHILQPTGSPQSTSVTSLHSKLIESVSAAGDRFHPHHTGHNHIHSSGNNNQQHGSNRFSSSSSAPAGVSKGGPLGISGGIMGLSISPNSNSPHKGHAGSAATSATPEMSSKSKLYIEHPGLPGNSHTSTHDRERKLLAEAEFINGNRAKEAMLTKQRMLTRSPEDFSSARSHHHHQQQQLHQHHLHDHSPQKTAKSISFAGDMHSGIMHRQNNHHPYMNGQVSHHHSPSHLPSPQHTQGHHHSNSSSHCPSAVSVNLSTDYKRATTANSSHITGSSTQQHHLFLPPSPKKRSAHWNFAVPQSPVNNGNNGMKTGELLSPRPPSSDSISDSHIAMSHISSAKYLSPNQNQKPSNGGPGVAGMHPHHHNPYQSSSAAQPLLVVPSSPHSSSSPSSHGGSSGPSTPKSPSVHFKFFGSANNKENNGTATSGQGRNGRILNTRNDSSSSTSSVELGVININGRRQNNCGPWPVEQMPLISAFRKGSMIKLASGDMKTVEDLKEEDFEKAVQMMSDSVRIVYCHVISIQPSPLDNSLCKVTLAMGAAHQQVVVESTPEQPFFIRGRGWASSSPKLTEKHLQLPCSTLLVGDICITLTRHVKTQSHSTSGGHHPTSSGGGRGSKSKSGTTRPYGTYTKHRNSSTGSILKNSYQPRGSNSMRMNGRKVVSGQTSLAAANHDANTNSILRQQTSVKESLSVGLPQSDEQRNEKEVSSSPHISPSAPHDHKVVNSDSISAQSSRVHVTNNNSYSKEEPLSSLSSSNSRMEVANTLSETHDTPVTPPNKRKSISPCPAGSDKNEDVCNVDEGLRPPSPKKRRWSAPEQIEAESQQNSRKTASPTDSSYRVQPDNAHNDANPLRTEEIKNEPVSPTQIEEMERNRNSAESQNDRTNDEHSGSNENTVSNVVTSDKA